MSKCGIGDNAARFNVYIANRPNFANFEHTTDLNPVHSGDIRAIGQACGNGWRKVFNVYAKLLFALGFKSSDCILPNWQALRDEILLQADSGTSLLFSSPSFEDPEQFHLVMGKHFARALELPFALNWLDDEFALNLEHKLIVCPYFDYRQLSNIKIIRLVDLIQRHKLH